jgi:RimJ/RimL family protein N-acetyltransferase
MDGIALRVLSSYASEGVFEQDVANLTVWRNCEPYAFLSVFRSTRLRTINWIRDSYMKSDSDLMLIMEDQNGIGFGHFAFTKVTQRNAVVACQLERVLRAPGLGSAEAMRSAVELGLDWCAATLNISRITLHVFAANHRAIKLYKDLSFRTVKRLHKRQSIEASTQRRQKKLVMRALVLMRRDVLPLFA